VLIVAKENVMETLQLLEQRVSQLIARVKELKEHNLQLAEQNKQLEAEQAELFKKIDSMEVSMLSSKESLYEEKELTRFAVDELIKNIDSLVGSESL